MEGECTDRRSVKDEHYDVMIDEMVDIGGRGIYVSVVPHDHDIAQEEGGGPKKSLRQPLLADQHAINHPPRPVPPKTGSSKILMGAIDMHHSYRTITHLC
jgi:hypothetical protein